jgi:ubiquinone/menaquinone biosynthesis C-methylase UbiE
MNADPIAKTYRYFERAAFGSRLEACRLAWLDRLDNAQRVLIVGEGDGRFLEQLLARNRQVRVDVVDLSGTMLQLAAGRVQEERRGSVRLLRQNALETGKLPDGPYDAVVTHFFLDCFSEADAQRVIRALAGRLAEDGVWLVSEFREPASGWRSVHARVWLRVMYSFFRVTTGLRASRLPPVAKLMSAAGMMLEGERMGWAHLMSAQVWKPKPAAVVPPSS